MVANLKDPPRHRYTLEEYFALERVGEARYEYWDGEIVCMSGGSRRHYLISDNLHAVLSDLLKGRDCRAFTGSLPIKTPSLPPYRYPDAGAVCDEMKFENIGGIDVLTNPVLIVEVLSPGTEHLDKEEKRRAYQKISSLKEYLIIAQDAPHATQYVRQGRRWERRDVGDLGALLELPSLGCRLSLSEIYSGVKFD
ncbi:MAG: Uma2 family endonuclease [Acidobacteria bacterium]|nr:Uma2 family endonuclease [Acidobacteriota bacterium]MCW5971546.1 Uma2 family endonuclease [Blastocatellales bacterium]